MVRLIALMFLFSGLSCAHHGQQATGEASNFSAPMGHRMISSHSHRHGEAGCGHEKVVEGGKTYYKHDGEMHFPHSGHYDKK